MKVVVPEITMSGSTESTGAVTRIFYTPEEVARIFHTSPVVVRHNVRAQTHGWEFPYQVRGNRMKISRAAVDRAVAEWGGISDAGGTG